MNDQELQIFTRWLSNSLNYRLQAIFISFSAIFGYFFLSLSVLWYKSIFKSICLCLNVYLVIHSNNKSIGAHSLALSQNKYVFFLSLSLNVNRVDEFNCRKLNISICWTHTLICHCHFGWRRKKNFEDKKKMKTPIRYCTFHCLLVCLSVSVSKKFL